MIITDSWGASKHGQREPQRRTTAVLRLLIRLVLPLHRTVERLSVAEATPWLDAPLNP